MPSCVLYYNHQERQGKIKMNLKEILKNLTDEELGEILSEYANRQLEKVKKEEEETEHYYEFTGTWVFGIWAKSKEEAEKYFRNANMDEFDILTDEYTIEQND